jgi:hypothetical protein
VETVSSDDVRRLRVTAQHLDQRLPKEQLANVVRDVCGIQGQQSAAMLLALRARVANLTVDDVKQAIAEDRRVVRTWAMRGTLHLMANEDVQWMVDLFGPVFAAKDERRRLELGVTDKLAKKGLAAIREILADGEVLTRHELREKMNEHGVDIPEKGQALIHLIGLAAMEGIICLGPDRENGQFTYALSEQWIGGESRHSKEALTDLARRYISGYGPADAKDFAAWSGLKASDVKAAWQVRQEASDAKEIEVDGRKLLVDQSAFGAKPKRETTVRLVPAFDAYVLGYADRDWLVAPEHRNAVYHGGQTVPVVLVDGMAAGVWRYDQQPKRIKMRVQGFAGFGKNELELIREEAKDIGRFLGKAMSVEID